MPDARPSIGGNFLKKFKLITNSYPIIHNRVKGMIVDQRRNLLYTTGKEGTIHAQDLAKKTTFGAIKCKNASPECLAFDADTNRLYVASREGQVLIFDCRSNIPLMIHVVCFQKVNIQDYVKQIDFDPYRNCLYSRTKYG